VRKPGYDAAPFNIAMLPRDQHPDIGVAPTFAIVQQVFEDHYSLAADCVGTTPLSWVECSKSVAFTVHHQGGMKLLDLRGVLFEWGMQMRRGQKVLC
jgi:hypothetical protein